jgi:hypothetical protein
MKLSLRLLILVLLAAVPVLAIQVHDLLQGGALDMVASSRKSSRRSGTKLT